MEHSVEISQRAFQAILNFYDEVDHMSVTKTEEHCRKTFYVLPCGTTILKILNFVSVVEQYYIQDINA